MLNNIQFTCVLVVFNGISRALGQLLPDETLYEDNACYGFDANYSFFHASCSTNHAIALSKIKGGAKPYTTGCPQEINGTDSINFSVCCVYSPGDCIEEFPGALKTYHERCSGEQACKFGTPATRDRFVNCQEQLVTNSFNSYMELGYYCIDKATTGSTCTSVSMTTSGKALYLWNNGYPYTATADCNCSIEVNSSTAQIDVTAMRIELVRNSNSCIRFLDGVYAKEITLCSDVSTITHIFTSTSNYLLMKYIRGHINDTGRYWIRFKATDSSANLIVQCQPESKPVCTTTTSTTTKTSTTTSTTTTPSTTTSTTSTPSTTTSTTSTPSTTTSTTSTPSTTTSTTSTPSTSTSTTSTPSTTTSTTRLTSITAIINTPSTTIHISNSTTKPKLNEEKASESVMIGVIIGVCLLLLIVVIVIIIYRRVILPVRNRKEAEKENKRVEQSTEPSDNNKFSQRPELTVTSTSLLLICKEEKTKIKKKRKKNIEEEEGEEMKDGRIKIKQRHEHTEEGEGVQNGEEMKRKRKTIKENFGEEEKEIHNGKDVVSRA